MLLFTKWIHSFTFHSKRGCLLQISDKETFFNHFTGNIGQDTMCSAVKQLSSCNGISAALVPEWKWVNSSGLNQYASILLCSDYCATQ